MRSRFPACTCEPLKRSRWPLKRKTQTTGDHLQRVRVYAMELAKELGLSEDETEALRAASVLHDIGKLAVPEHIISKPGKLTPEEFEKMKIHPIGGRGDSGAGRLSLSRGADRAGSPRKMGWQRISATDWPARRFRSAPAFLPRSIAWTLWPRTGNTAGRCRWMKPWRKVVADAGKSFDPQVVAILQRRYIELEKLANEQPLQAPPKLSTDIKVERGSAPAAGFAESGGAKAELVAAGDRFRCADFGGSANKVGRSLDSSSKPDAVVSAEDIFSLLAVRLKHLVPHQALAVYCPQQWRAGCGVCERGKFPFVFFFEDSARRRDCQDGWRKTTRPF